MREVEALYNQILRELMDNPTLEPQDIVVMTPDIELYAPFIHAIFGSAPKERYLPYSISDVSLKESETIFTALLQLLALPESTFKASDLLMLIQLPEIMEKFHFEERDLALIHFWIHDANIKQALDGQQLTDELQVPYNNQFDWDINTWRWGLRRMLLGYGSESATLTLSEDNDHTLYPYAHVEGKMPKSSATSAILLIFLPKLEISYPEIKQSMIGGRYCRSFGKTSLRKHRRIMINYILPSGYGKIFLPARKVSPFTKPYR